MTRGINKVNYVFFFIYNRKKKNGCEEYYQFKEKGKGTIPPTNPYKLRLEIWKRWAFFRKKDDTDSRIKLTCTIG